MVLPSTVKGVFLTQAVITALISLISFQHGLNSALSALLGGGVALVPSLGFARCFFGEYANKRSARRVLSRLYWAEALKLVSTILGICLCMQWPDILPVPFFITFVACQFVYWINGLISSVQEKLNYVR